MYILAMEFEAAQRFGGSRMNAALAVRQAATLVAMTASQRTRTNMKRKWIRGKNEIFQKISVWRINDEIFCLGTIVPLIL